MRTLSLLVEDTGVSAKHRQRFLATLADCFANIIRLSNTITGCNGATLRAFVAEVKSKVAKISENQVPAQNLNDELQDEIDRATKEATKVLMEEVLDVYAKELALWKETTATCSKSYH